MDEKDSHVKYPDRLQVVLHEAGVRYELVPLRQPGAFAIVAFLLETDDGCMDIEEQNEAAYQACLKIAQAALRFASSDLRGILRDEFVALRARAEAAEAKVTALVGAGDGLEFEGGELAKGWHLALTRWNEAKAAWTKAKEGSDGRG